MIRQDTQTWAQVVTIQNGPIFAAPDPNLLTNQIFLVATGVANVSTNKSFKLLVANFGSIPIELCQLQSITEAHLHSANLVESHIFHGEILGLIVDEHQDGKFRVRHIAPNNNGIINKHWAYQRESNLTKHEKLTTADYIKVNFSPNKKGAVRDMLRKYEKIWSGQLIDGVDSKLRAVHVISNRTQTERQSIQVTSVPGPFEDKKS